MSKFKKYDLRQLRQNKADLGVDVIEFDAADGSRTFRIPAPGFFPDEAHAAMKATDSLALAAALLGSDLDAFHKTGGKADDIGLLIEAWGEEQGTSVPKS